MSLPIGSSMSHASSSTTTIHAIHATIQQPPHVLRPVSHSWQLPLIAPEPKPAANLRTGKEHGKESSAKTKKVHTVNQHGQSTAGMASNGASSAHVGGSGSDNVVPQESQACWCCCHKCIILRQHHIMRHSSVGGGATQFWGGGKVVTSGYFHRDGS
jgi:hypothetical protein